MNTDRRSEISPLIKQFEALPNIKDTLSKDPSSSNSSKEISYLPKSNVPLPGPSHTKSLRIRASCDLADSSCMSYIQSKRGPYDKSLDSLQSERKFLSPVNDSRRNSHQLPKVKSAKAFSSNSLKNKWEVITMLSNNSSSLNITTAQNVMRALTVLAKEPGIYQEEMILIVNQLQRCVFCAKEEIPTYLQNELYDLYIDAVGSLNEYIPYFYLYKSCISLNGSFQERYQAQQDTINSLKQALIELKQSKEQETSKLIESLNSVQLSMKPITDENERLKTELRALQEKYARLEDHKKEVDAKLVSVMASIKEDNKIIADLQDKNRKQADLNNLLSEEHNKLKQNFNELNQKYTSMTSSYASLLAKLKQAYQQHQTYEDRLKEIEEENYRLNMRAAVGFDDLTPRPNMQILFQELDKPYPAKSTTISMVNLATDSIRSFKAKLASSSSKKVIRKQGHALSKKKNINEEPKRDTSILDTPNLSQNSKAVNLSQSQQDIQS